MRISDWSSDVCSSDLPECQPEIRFLPESGLIEAKQLPQNGGEYFLWPTTWARGGNDRALHTDQIRNRPLVATFERRQEIMAGGKERIVSVSRQGEGRFSPSLNRRQSSVIAKRSEEHKSDLPSLMRSSYAGSCWKQKRNTHDQSS